MKILILGKNRIKMHSYYYELWKQEIARHHDVRYYGIGYGEHPLPKGISIYKVINDLEFEPDLIHSQLVGDVKFGLVDLKKIKIPKAHYATEYYHWNRNKEERFVRSYDPDLVLLPRRRQVEMMSLVCNARLLLSSVDTNVFKPRDVDRDIPVSAVMTARGSKLCNALYFDRRDIIKETTKVQESLTLARRGGQRKTTLWHDQYIDTYARSKIAVAGTKLAAESQSSEAYITFTPQKVLEILACGALLLTQYDADFEILGLRHLENCVVFDQPSEIPAVVDSLLEQDELRQKIAKAGLDLVVAQHSNKIRVQQFTKIIQEELGIED